MVEIDGVKGREGKNVYHRYARARDAYKQVSLHMPSQMSRQPSRLWDFYPNLRRRPHSPNKNRGRLQVQIRRAFAVNGPVLTSSQVYDWTHARKRDMDFRRWDRWAIHRMLAAIADPIGRGSTRGKPWVWRLRPEDDG
jgi:hypothetical protein